MRGMRWFLMTSCAAAITMLNAPSLQAQQWTVEAQAGRIRSALDPNAPQSQTIVLGVRYDDALTGLRVSGGIPTTANDPLWGAVSGARRLALSADAFRVGVDVAGNAFLLHDRVQRTQQIPGVFGPKVASAPSLSGSAWAGQVLPLIGFESNRVQAYARAGVSQYYARFGAQDRTRNVRLADAQLSAALTGSLILMPALRHVRAAEGSYTYAGATVLLAQGPLSMWAGAGQWQSDSSSDNTQWAAGAALRVLSRATVSASVRREAIDPLYLAPPQTAWNVGVSVALGTRPTLAAPVPARYENGRATIRLPAARTLSRPRIAGDFNGWQPAPMERSGNEWTYTLALKPGVYNYAFVDERGEWFVPEKYPGRKDDGMGGHVAVLVVQR